MERTTEVDKAIQQLTDREITILNLFYQNNEEYIERFLYKKIRRGLIVKGKPIRYSTFTKQIDKLVELGFLKKTGGRPMLLSPRVNGNFCDYVKIKLAQEIHRRTTYSNLEYFPNLHNKELNNTTHRFCRSLLEEKT